MFFYLYAYEPIHAGKGWKNAIVTWYQKFKESVFFRKLFFLAFLTSLILFRTLLNRQLWMNALSDVNPKMIYSMWDGYLNPKKPAYNEKLAIFCQKYNAIIKHTSGHAYPELIEQVINKVNPTQRIWPIHTENVKGFLDLNILDELKGKVRVDG